MGLRFSKKKKHIPVIEEKVSITCLESELIRKVNVIVIGHNTTGDLGLKSIKEINELTVLDTIPDFDFAKDINIYASDMSTFYAINNKYYYASGSNFKGQLGINSTALFNSTPTKITFFHDQNMSIKQLCCNSCTSTVFWITENNKVYANGTNDQRQLGLATSVYSARSFESWPVRTLSFKEYVWIIDVQSISTKSIALFGTSYAAMMIIDHWIRTMNAWFYEFDGSDDHRDYELFAIVPEEIIALLIEYHGFEANKLYCTTSIGKPWKELHGFEYINIHKISAGLDHFLCLSAIGDVYEIDDKSSEPTIIKYFEKHKIKIDDIQCGAGYNLALDINGNAYSWPTRNYDNLFEPQLLFPTQKYVVIEISCGYDHSYCKTEDALHFLFGGNDYNQCITYDDRHVVLEPFCINEIVKETIGANKTLNSVHVGYKSTKLVVVS